MRRPFAVDTRFCDAKRVGHARTLPKDIIHDPS